MSAAVACAAALTACALVPRPHVLPRAEVRGFVTADGTGFRLDGSPYRFVGVNIYDATATARYACDRRMPLSDAELTAVLDKLHDAHGATVLRFWAYQTYTDGGGDFTGVDRVIRIAKAAGMRVLPVLEDRPGDCTTSVQVVPKEQCLVNEAQTTARDAQGRSALVDFAADTAAVVRAVDPNHLVTPGTQANGAPGRAAPTSPSSYGIPQLDFAELHDWNADDEAMPAAPTATPRRQLPPVPGRRREARVLLRAALGDQQTPCWSARRASAPTPAARRTRATQLAAKMRGAFAAGASGYLLWHVTKEARDQYATVLARVIRCSTSSPTSLTGSGRTATNCRAPRSKVAANLSKCRKPFRTPSAGEHDVSGGRFAVLTCLRQVSEGRVNDDRELRQRHRRQGTVAGRRP